MHYKDLSNSYVRGEVGIGILGEIEAKQFYINIKNGVLGDGSKIFRRIVLLC